MARLFFASFTLFHLSLTFFNQRFPLTVSCPQTLTLDGVSLKSDALCGVPPDHLLGGEVI